jgi:hypothetical protein
MSGRNQVFPKWVPFGGPASFKKAQELGLAPGDGISVWIAVTSHAQADSEPCPSASREHGMDLVLCRAEEFVAQDPDGSTHTYEWADAASYWIR